MYIIPIAWLYVALMMALAEATNSNGTILGAIITFVLYGVLPIGLMLYFMGTPARKRALREREAAERAQYLSQAALQPDAGGHAATDAVAPVAEETAGVADRAPRQ
jgi:hypothetical protein